MVRIPFRKKKLDPETQDALVVAKKEIQDEIVSLRKKKETLGKEITKITETSEKLPDVKTLEREPLKFKSRVSDDVKLLVVVMDRGYHEEVPCSFVGEDKITFKTSDGERRTVYIFDQPALREREHGALFFKTRKREIVFYVGKRAELTHNPANGALDIPTIQMAQRLAVSLIENDVIDSVANAAESSKQWREYLPYLFMFLEFIVATVLMSGLLENLG